MCGFFRWNRHKGHIFDPFCFLSLLEEPVLDLQGSMIQLEDIQFVFSEFGLQTH